MKRKNDLRPGQNGKYWVSKKPGRDGATDPWCRTWYEKDSRQTRRESLGTTDKEEATRLLAAWIAQNERPQDGRRENVLIEDALIFYWNEHAKNLPSAITQQQNLAAWQEFWKGKTVSEITSHEQKKFREWLGEGRLSSATIDRHSATGRAALRYAVKHEMLESSPHIFMIETPGEKESRKPMGRPLSPAEMAKFIDAIIHPHLMFFTVILANTLARAGAIFDLRRAQYDDEIDRVALNPEDRIQTKKRRPTLPVTPTLQRWLNRSMGPNDHYVNYYGEPIGALWKSWLETVKRSGLEGKVTPYSFRHGMARLLRQRRISLDDLGVFMGHKHSGVNKTTAIYAPDDPDYLSNVAEMIEQVMTEVKSHLKLTDLDNPEKTLARLALIPHVGNGHLPEAQQNALDDLLKKGKKPRELSELFGVSRTAVYKRRKKLGLG